MLLNYFFAVVCYEFAIKMLSLRYYSVTRSNWVTK